MVRRPIVATYETSATPSCELDPYTDLPPADAVPILRHLGELGLERFRELYAFETPLDERGFVDYGQLLGQIDKLVEDRDFRWPNRNYDVHHLQWESGAYDPMYFEDFDDSSVPSEFREIPFHKLYIPRQLHNLIHRVTLPPPVPEFETMQRRVDAYKLAKRLFETASISIEIQETERRAIRLPNSGTRVLDPKKRRVIEREVLVDRYKEFTSKYYNQLSEVAKSDLDGLINMSALDTSKPIPQVAASLERAVITKPRRKAIRPKLRTALYTPVSEAA